MWSFLVLQRREDRNPLCIGQLCHAAVNLDALVLVAAEDLGAGRQDLRTSTTLGALIKRQFDVTRESGVTNIG
jgi:hypothetical protein